MLRDSSERPIMSREITEFHRARIDQIGMTEVSMVVRSGGWGNLTARSAALPASVTIRTAREDIPRAPHAHQYEAMAAPFRDTPEQQAIR